MRRRTSIIVGGSPGSKMISDRVELKSDSCSDSNIQRPIQALGQTDPKPSGSGAGGLTAAPDPRLAGSTELGAAPAAILAVAAKAAVGHPIELRLGHGALRRRRKV